MIKISERTFKTPRTRSVINAERRVVRKYLAVIGSRAQLTDALRIANADEMHEELEAVGEALEHANGLDRLTLMQRQIELRRSLAVESRDSFDELERQFVEVMSSYSTRHGISRSAWLVMGVPAVVVEQMGIYAP